MAEETNEGLRPQANQAYRLIKKIQGKQPAKELVENTLKNLDDDCKAREEQLQKRQFEAQAEAKFNSSNDNSDIL